MKRIPICFLVLLFACLFAPVTAETADEGLIYFGVTLDLIGVITDDSTMNEAYFDLSVDCHPGSFIDENGIEWIGMPLWYLVGFVDDYNKHGSGAYNDMLADEGYTIVLRTSEGYEQDLSSQEIKRNDEYLIVKQTDVDTFSPYKLVGPSLTEEQSIDDIVAIELVDVPFDAPEASTDSSSATQTLRIVKFGEDEVTPLEEKILTVSWLEENLPVIGEDDGIRLRIQGPTFLEDDLWNPAEDINVAKVDEVIRGTSLDELITLVGGMEEENTLVLVASDGYKTYLDYHNVYDYPETQGTALLAWWNERQGYDYENAFRLFFDTPDGIFGNQDMKDSFSVDNYKYYWQGGVQYPSAAGASAQMIDAVEVHTSYIKDWALELTGAIDSEMSRGFFESGVACAHAGTHMESYTDEDGREWYGMPLWLFAGFVDDANEHSGKAYNEEMALEGYTIRLYGADGSIAEFNSAEVSRSPDFIVANVVDGARIDGNSPEWPLVITGSGVPKADRIGGITKIELDVPRVEKETAEYDNSEIEGVVLFDEVVSADDSTVIVTAASGAEYDVSIPTPLGALISVLDAQGVSYDIGDKSIDDRGILLLDGVSEYLYSKEDGLSWIVTVNDEVLDDWSSPETDGLNIRELIAGDTVTYYYGEKDSLPDLYLAKIILNIE